jgi:hypothetical protein
VAVLVGVDVVVFVGRGVGVAQTVPYRTTNVSLVPPRAETPAAHISVAEMADISNRPLDLAGGLGLGTWVQGVPFQFRMNVLELALSE